MNRILLLSLTGAALLLALASCAAPHTSAPTAPSTSATLPPQSAASTNSPVQTRPDALRLDGIDPCQLLTADQQGALKIHMVGESSRSPVPGILQCSWAANSFDRSDMWLAQVEVNRGLSSTLISGTSVEAVQIDGFHALQGSTPGKDGSTDCAQFIDIAQGQTLAAIYDNEGSTPGTSHQLACKVATTFSTMMIQNLRAHSGG
jgi:hypothetical protein